MMLHTKYQNSRPCGFLQEHFFKDFFKITLCKTDESPNVATFDPRGII